MHDKFHVSVHHYKAVDDVRNEKHRVLTGSAENLFKDWHRAVKRSKLKLPGKVAEILANRLRGLLNHLNYRITNAASVGMYSLVVRVIANARGPRTFLTLRVRVLFFLGKPELAVRTSA